MKQDPITFQTQYIRQITHVLQAASAAWSKHNPITLNADYLIVKADLITLKIGHLVSRLNA